MLSGCFGIAVNSPVECVNETPYTGVHDFFSMPSVNKERLTPKASTKAEFLKKWGDPDKVISAAEKEDVWVYERNLWCGVIPIAIIPVPLILPVCDGFDKIYFLDGNAKRLHTRHTSTALFFIGIGGSGSASDPICKYPIPYHTANSKGGKPPLDGPSISGRSYSMGDKIPDNAGLVVFYRPSLFVGADGTHTVHVNDDFMVPLYNGSYYPYLSALGENEFWIHSFSSKKSLKINIQPGQTYYVRFRMGFFAVDFEQVPEEIAEMEIAGLKLLSGP